MFSTYSEININFKNYQFNNGLNKSKEIILKFLKLYFENVKIEKEHRFSFETQSIFSEIQNEALKNNEKIKENFDNVELNLKKHLSEIVSNIKENEFSEFSENIIKEHLKENFNQLQLLKEKKAKLKNELGQVYFLIGNELIHKGKYRKSKDNFLKAVSFKPSITNGWVNAAVISRINGDANDSINLLKKALKFDKNDFFIFHNLGMSYLINGNAELAIDNFKRALVLNPDDIDSKIFHAFTIAKYKKFEIGLNILEELASTSDDLILNYNIGVILQENKDFDKAIKYYHKCILQNENDFSSLMNLGFCYGLIRKYDDAIKYTQKAISINSEDYMTWINLGNAFLHDGKYPEALCNYTEATKLEPMISIGWRSIGEVYKITDEYEKALVYYNKAIKLDPNDHLTYFGIYGCAIELEDLELSQYSYDKIEYLSPGFLKLAYSIEWQ